MSDALLTVRDLHVTFESSRGRVFALQGINLDIPRGGILGLVGESGCGKSVTARAILNLLPDSARITQGQISLVTDTDKLDLTKLHPASATMRRVRWKEISIVFQEPSTALGPVHTIGNQIVEVLRLHENMGGRAARERAIELLDRVGIPDAKRRFESYPFQLSGGMRQRAVIAMALACKPKLLIADEPTTALDVTLQAQILELLCDLQETLGMAIMLITHDLSVIANVAQRVAVMYLGKVVEEASTVELFDNPQHPYTQGLLASIPHAGLPRKAKLAAIRGAVHTPLHPWHHCAFQPRCDHAVTGVCEVSEPPVLAVSDGHRVRCVLPERPEGQQTDRNVTSA